MIISYLGIYFLIEEQFDSSALLVPAEDASMGGIAGLIGNFGSNLPFDIGAGSSPEMNMYNTIIYSRTNLQKIIDKFDLYKVYKLNPEVKDYKKKAIKILSSNISANETELYSYELTVRSNSPQLSADIANYIIKKLNEKLIELKTQKSKSNRIFLGERVDEIRKNLNNAEDSLMIYQKESGILEPIEQFKGIVNAYTLLETELITKQIEKSILMQLKGENSPLVNNITIEVEEYERKIREIKNIGSPEGMIPALDALPEKGIIYFRLLREVEINSKILEFILPFYEQAKIEEKKDIPTLQIIDNAIPPEKKSYPPRTIITLVITFGVFIMTFFFILIKENQNWQQSEKFIFIRKNLFRWKHTG
ncbi:GumC family protein, partial [Bacteroidota bacterium]